MQDINKDLISVEDSEELEERRANLDQLLYNLKINVDRLAGSKEEKPPLMTSGVTEMSSISLPRIEIPAFDGNILNWRIFCKQFESTIHSKSHLKRCAEEWACQECSRSRSIDADPREL